MNHTITGPRPWEDLASPDAMKTAAAYLQTVTAGVTRSVVTPTADGTGDPAPAATR